MKRLFTGTIALLFMLFSFSGCSPVGDKSASLTIIYAAAAILSLLLMVGYCCLVRNKNLWFVVMFSAITVVNVGYFCLAASSSLGEALLSNRIAYLGQVVLPAAMLMIILKITNTPSKKWLPYCLLVLSACVLFVAASPGILDIYYKEVDFEIINGVGTLVKVYGPLHPLYLLYLVGYFAAMVTVIVRAWIKKTVDSTSHAIIIAIAVFVNIGVWFIEQLVSIEFEMLSISYIISELFLLGVHLVMTEQQRLMDLIKEKGQSALLETPVLEQKGKSSLNNDIDKEATKLFTDGYDTLTKKEQELFWTYISGATTKEIMITMNITENTLKYHSRNLYGKLGVSSRKQLEATYRRIKATGKVLDELNN